MTIPGSIILRSLIYPFFYSLNVGRRKRRPAVRHAHAGDSSGTGYVHVKITAVGIGWLDAHEVGSFYTSHINDTAVRVTG